jgi:prevent-host-death family protein
MESYSVNEAKSRFSELLSRAAAGERFIIERRDRPVAVLISPDELDQLERAHEASRRLALALGQDIELLDAIERGEVHPAMAGFGLWRDDELDAIEAEIYANRDRQVSRPVPEL